MGREPTALLFANTDWYLYNFRRSLADRLRDQGWRVVLVSPPGEYADRLGELGFRHHGVEISNRSKNPVAELRLLRRLFSIYSEERPTLAHHFTVKCILYGTLVARFVGGVKVVNAVTGLGYLFTDEGLAARLLRTAVRPIYRSVLNYGQGHVICQNRADRDELVERGLVSPERVTVIRGSGVDCETFRPDGGSGSRGGGRPVRVLFASRLLREKGVVEFLDAARRLGGSRDRLQFWLAGDIYPDNPSSLTREDLRRIEESDHVEYLGHVDDMPSLLAETDIVTLPSYAEGTPRILIEAAATGTPIVATAIPGCEGLVRDGVNGYLVPVRDARALGDAILELAESPDRRREFGAAGRRIAESEFDEDIVLDRTLEVYASLTGEDEVDAGSS